MISCSSCACLCRRKYPGKQKYGKHINAGNAKPSTSAHIGDNLCQPPVCCPPTICLKLHTRCRPTSASVALLFFGAAPVVARRSRRHHAKLPARTRHDRLDLVDRGDGVRHGARHLLGARRHPTTRSRSALQTHLKALQAAAPSRHLPQRPWALYVPLPVPVALMRLPLVRALAATHTTLRRPGSWLGLPPTLPQTPARQAGRALGQRHARTPNGRQATYTLPGP